MAVALTARMASVAGAALWTRVNTACWSPGMQGTSGQVLAESIVLRGARRGGAPVQTAQAGDLLDQSLLPEGTADTHVA